MKEAEILPVDESKVVEGIQEAEIITEEVQTTLNTDSINELVEEGVVIENEHKDE